MSGIAYVALAGGVVVVVAALGILAFFDIESWLAEGLRRGDLHALIDVASGLRPDGLTRGQAERLQARGMVRTHRSAYRATFKGKLALRVKYSGRQSLPHRGEA
jgi:hypothetical protein